MILVTLGTQDKKFTRLLEAIEALIEKGLIKEKVIVQAGYSSDYKSEKMEIVNLISKMEFEQLMKQASLVITHGGVGSILTALKYHKKVIAIPRLQKYKEHVNDHQIQIVQNFNDEGYIIGVYLEDLEQAIKKIKDFTPKVYKSNKDHVLKLLEKLIEA